MFAAWFGDRIDYRVYTIYITMEADLLPRFMAIAGACSGSSLMFSASTWDPFVAVDLRGFVSSSPRLYYVGLFPFFFFFLVFLPISFICSNV